MAKVIILPQLEDKINKKFKKESVDVFELLYSLEKNPNKGKPLGNISGVVIKELKYKNFRFYFVTNGYILRVLDEDELRSVIIKFVRMSTKKDQQEVIDEIKSVLRKLGEEGFS
jgi:hypothetical protein